MGPRKVGTTPFNLQAFFQRSDEINKTDAAIKKSFDDYMTCLRDLCDYEMTKTGVTRLGLASLVGEACYQRWKKHLGKQVKEPWPFTEVEKKKRRSLGISEPQYDFIKNGQLDTWVDLMAYLQGVNQIPQPKNSALMPSPATNGPKAATAATSTPKSTASAPSKTPAIRPISSYGEPIAKNKSKKPQLQPVQSTSTENETSPNHQPSPAQVEPSPGYQPRLVQIQIPKASTPSATLDWEDGTASDEMAQTEKKISGTNPWDVIAEKISTSDGSVISGSSSPPHNAKANNDASDDDESYMGPNAITDYDYWAFPEPNCPGYFVEAPKLPGCGPWELRLPDTMDPEVFIKPDIERICQLLGGIRLMIKTLPASITVMPTLPQRAAILSDKSEDSIITQTVQATRWKAFRLLLLWAKHVRKHAKPPADPPKSMVAFIEQQVREDVIKQGEVDRDFVAAHIAGRLQRGLAAFPGRNYQMPKRPSVSEFEYAPDPKRQRSATYSPAPPKVGPEDEEIPFVSSPREQSQKGDEAASFSSDSYIESSIRIGYSGSTTSPDDQARRENPMDIDNSLDAAIDTAIQQSGFVDEHLPNDIDHVGGTHEEGEPIEHSHFKQENTLHY